MAALLAFLKTWIQKIMDLFFRRRGEEVVDYYGCPNSKKAQKLQLKKNIIK